MNGSDVYEFDPIELDVCSACGQKYVGQEDDIIPDLIRALELCLKYLQHPEVQEIPFVFSADKAAKRVIESIRKAKEAEL